MATSTVVLIVAIGVCLAWAVFGGGRLPAPFGFRSCQGKSWRRSFPDASKDEIRLFLSTFTESFAFRDSEKLKLNPNDQLLDIYHSLYPHKWQADAMELETFGEALESKYGIILNNVWHNGLTLGQLLIQIRQAGK